MRDRVEPPRDPGALPAWSVGELPAPPPFGLRGVMKVIGPGAILLATSIGGGEWLVGPAAGVQYGTGIMGVATIAILLQLTFNLEAIRYTRYTGEPIYTGFMRLAPGPRFWMAVYALFAIVQLGWPALVLSSAGTLFSMAAGRLPAGEADTAAVLWLGVLVVALTAALLLFGGTIERMLEYASWVMLAFIFTFLTAVNVIFVPAAHWVRTLGGFFRLDAVTGGVDWTLLGALAGTAGAGGIGNLTITNWMRDKGFGMGARVGAVDSAVGARHTRLSPIGTICPVDEVTLARWRDWWRYVHADQVGVWALFCFVGLFLTVNLATSVIPRGSEMQGLATGAYQAHYMAQRLWAGLWHLTLLNGFWILFSTHLGNTDLLIRTITVLSWTASSTARRWSGGRASRIYYALLVVFTAWAIASMRVAGPFALFKLMANVAGFVLAVGAVQVLIVNRRFLPRALRAPLWREAVLLLAGAFYGFFTFKSLAGWLE